MRALLIGEKPPCDLGFTYESAPPYDGAVIGSLTLGQALYFADEQLLSFLAEGKPVVCYAPGFPQAPRNRALGAALASSRRNMKSWGIVFTDGGQKRLITAQEARALRQAGKQPAPGSVLTPLAKEVLEGSDGSAAGGR
ncbi:MAG: hypothetical protein IJ030_05535 [Oscillospiraceae bacterium]|nr:hypothetical protein [Oscillospiraceae bacterium]